jgi:hypothetical protein
MSILVKKYRYNGLRRPKWVAYNFGGLGQNNPNQRKWQMQAKIFSSHKYEFIWDAETIFKKNSIEFFILADNIRKLNYYSHKKLYFNFYRLVDNRVLNIFKYFLFKKQKGLCLLCHFELGKFELCFVKNVVDLNLKWSLIFNKKGIFLVHRSCII